MFEETALSPGVKNLLCSTGIGVWIRDYDADDGETCEAQCSTNFVPASTDSDSNYDCPFLNKDGFIIEECYNFLNIDGDLQQHDSSFYARAAFKLSPMFRECEKFWTKVDFEEFSIRCKQCFEWTGNEQLFLDCFDMLQKRRGSQAVLALLLLCTGIEQCLRNIFLLENEQCPLLLKDILSSREIEKILGKPATHLFQVLLGPPISMNLRNVVWHGFLSENELPPRYAYVLLIFVASLSTQLSSGGVGKNSIRPKQYSPLSKVNCIIKSFPYMSDELLGFIRIRVLNSWVAAAQNKTLIQDVFDLHFEKKYGFSCAQGFPILEHALRRQFVKVNNCPGRLVTAEATSLYTTYEEILDCFLPDGQQNQLKSDLGEPFMELLEFIHYFASKYFPSETVFLNSQPTQDLLHDLLIYPNGPRARDKLGHGEADVYDTPPSLSLTIILCLGFLAVKLQDEHNSSHTDPLLQDFIAHIDNYESLFHPVTELKGKILALSIKSTQMCKCLRTTPDLQPWSPESQVDIFTKDNTTFHQIIPILIDLISLIDLWNLENFSVIKSRLSTAFETFHDSIDDALRTRVSTLHRWQKKAKCDASNVTESEIILLMHRAIVEMCTVLDQMECALEQRQEALDNRQLRSRQRDNMKRLICLFPSMILAVNYQTIVWTWLFRLLNQPDTDMSPHFKRIQKFLKSMLRIVENLRTYTSKDNNKWTKAEEIAVMFVQDGVEFVQGLHV